MKAHFLQHVPFEGPGSIESWLSQRGATLTTTQLFRGERVPSLDGLDLVIAGGGPMSVNDEAALPWLVDEKRFVRDAIERGIPVLGICLGAQLIASSLGARVYPNPVKEIGWFPIEGVAAPAGYFRFPAEARVFHWHGETFDLPPNAVRLARSAACENQAFQVGRVLGLQFHLETTPEGAASLVENCRDELVPGTYIQSEAAIQATPLDTFAAVNMLMADVLEYLLGGK